jgi:hypothetical protein
VVCNTCQLQMAGDRVVVSENPVAKVRALWGPKMACREGKWRGTKIPIGLSSGTGPLFLGPRNLECCEQH